MTRSWDRRQFERSDTKAENEATIHTCFTLGRSGMFDQLAVRQEIEQRNRLRTEAKLPSVSLDEIRRAEQIAARKEYEAQLRKFLKAQGPNKGSGFCGRMAWHAMKEEEFKEKRSLTSLL